MADFDPPWRLDPFQNIVEVGWNTGLPMMVLTFSYVKDSTTSEPYFCRMAGLPFGAGGYDLNAEEIIAGDGSPEPPIEDDITDAMLAYYYMWNYKPVKTDSSNTIDTSYDGVTKAEWLGWFSWWQQYPIASTIITASPPDNWDNPQMAEFAALVEAKWRVASASTGLGSWSISMGDVYETVHVSGSRTVYHKTLNQIVFFNLRKIMASLKKDNPDGPPPEKMSFSVNTGNITQGMSWELSIEAWQDRHHFPVDDQNVLQDDDSSPPDGGELASSISFVNFASEGETKNAQTIVIDINFTTLELTGTSSA